MTIFVVKIRNDEFSIRILSLMFISKIQIILKVFKNLENNLFKIIKVLIIELLNSKNGLFYNFFCSKTFFFQDYFKILSKERRRDRREGGRREGGFRENFRGDGDGYRDRRPDRRSDRKDRRRSDRPRDQNNNDDLMVSLSSHLCSSVLGA